MDNKELLGKKWNAICHKVAIPLWNKKYKAMFAPYKLDYDDYIERIGIEMTVAIKNYNPALSNIFTFATNVINKKALSVIRDEGRALRKVALATSVSIYTPIDADEDMTLGDTLVAEEQEELSILAQRYLDSLTPKQRQVAELMMSGCNEKEIKETLNISADRYKLIIMAMCDSRKIAPLKKLRKEIL